MQFSPPGSAIAAYAWTGAPPSDAGGCQETSRMPLPAPAAVTACGGDAGPTGTIAADASEGDDLPAEFAAVTEKVYGVPFARPVMVQLVPDVEQRAPPGEAVATYSPIPPPVDEGGAHDTVTDPLPETPRTPEGEPGGLQHGVTGPDVPAMP